MKNKFSIAISLALIMAMLVTSLALASSVDVAIVDVTIPIDAVTFAPGGSGSININVTVTGNQAGTATFQVYRDWLLSGGTFTGSNPQTFTVPAGNYTAGNSWTNSTTGTVTVAAGQGIGTFTLAASAFNITNSNQTGGKLADGADSDYDVTVSAPADTTPPVITPSVVGTLGSNGWYVSDVTVSWTVSDPESAVTSSSGCGPTTINTDTPGTTLTCSATSAGGTNSQSVTIMRDTTAPTITFVGPSTSSWYNADVTANWSCFDALSGVVSTSVSGLASGEGFAVPAAGTCTDNAGNTASDTQSFIVDKTAPLVSVSASPAPNTNGWNNTDVTVSFSGSDGLSGIASCSAPVVLSSEGAGQSASGSCTDLAGNSASATSSGINIDKAAPVISAALDKIPAGSGWFNISTGVPTVSFTCGDALSGLDGACPADHTFGDGADQAYSQMVYDLAGNSASAGVNNVDVDTVTPSISASISPAMPSSGWWNIASGAPTVTYTSSDGTSGLASCSAPFTFPEGADQSNEGFAEDNAGNSNSASVSSIYVDLTTPSLDWNIAINKGDVFYFGFVPAYPPNPCVANDLLSGPASCAVAGYSTAIGAHTLLATAYDVAGNSYSEMRDYEVKAWTLTGFYKPVDMSGLITVWNTVKGGSTVPLKFEVFAGSTELTDTTAIKSLSAVQVSCTLGWEDTIETIAATGGTSLRYDWVEGQFIYNWQTPKKAGNCYKVTMTTQDNSSLTAFFKLK